MKMVRYFVEYLLFLFVFLGAFVLYQLPSAPTKFIYFNF
jgi:hypothetical protein